MAQSLNYRDLALRMLVILLTSLVLLFVTKENRFDLQMKIRKAQETLNNIIVVEVSEKSSIENVIAQIEKKNIQKIYVSQFLFETPTETVTPYIVGETNPRFLSLDLQPDEDGLTRRVRILSDLNHAEPTSRKNQTINFRGGPRTFSHVNYLDLISNEKSFLDKIVILKSSEPIETYTTPLGLLSEAEMVATILDNHFANRFIPDKNFIFPIIILILLLIATTSFLIYLPSTLALLSTLVLSVFYTSLSLWYFDTFYFWTPILTPLIQITMTFLLISNYKFVLNEKTRWSLEREAIFQNQVEEMKTNFLSLFSHDLKTPLAKILGIVDTLQSQIDDPKVLLELGKIHQSSKELEKYLKRILKMSQVQSKNISLNKESTDLNDLIKQAVDQNKDLAKQKNIKIETELSPLFMVEVDASLIKEVIINFLENAITYSPENSLVTVTSGETKDFLKVTVKDHGQGIPIGFQDNIWEKSFRFDKEKSGYGLGLFLSRYVVELHGGQVFLNSKEKRGSEFGFLLPLIEEI